ncbi:MAG: sulfate/molybdate ABC transporter ATP-binding protein [Phenylobacterium sp.]|uniref:sulfate/molybdate ABC transporter ATP-binding protein n=1 Tax=Phenylobacterium sp. TaxID=1871053 RepID=UPI00391D8749
MSLILTGLAKTFGAVSALRDVNLEVAEGEFLALLGPSGSGKTTLLRILAGLDQPTCGQIAFDGDDMLAMSARERRVGMVFQNYALFRHMTVAANVGFGLSVRPRALRPSGAAISARTEELLRLVQLDGYGARYPAQLSGGQQQRVALARALAIEPRLLLLDEPFGALDAKVRRELRLWLRRVHDETGVTTIFVTHDQEEALDLADRVAILRDGAVEQVGAPSEVYDAPASPFIFDFLGAANQARGAVAGKRLSLFGTRFEVDADAPQGPVTVFFRPHDVDLTTDDGAGFPARVHSVIARGSSVRLECAAEDGIVEVELPAPPPAGLARGSEIRLQPRRFALFPV